MSLPDSSHRARMAFSISPAASASVSDLSEAKSVSIRSDFDTSATTGGLALADGRPGLLGGDGAGADRQNEDGSTQEGSKSHHRAKIIARCRSASKTNARERAVQPWRALNRGLVLLMT